MHHCSTGADASGGASAARLVGAGLSPVCLGPGRLASTRGCCQCRCTSCACLSVCQHCLYACMHSLLACPRPLFLPMLAPALLRVFPLALAHLLSRLSLYAVSCLPMLAAAPSPCCQSCVFVPQHWDLNHTVKCDSAPVAGKYQCHTCCTVPGLGWGVGFLGGYDPGFSRCHTRSTLDSTPHIHICSGHLGSRPAHSVQRRRPLAPGWHSTAGGIPVPTRLRHPSACPTPTHAHVPSNPS